MADAHQTSLVIVTGYPGAGKTTLAQVLSRELGMPWFTKDDIKDVLFDVLGWSDRAWSMELGHAATMVLFHVVERELAARRSLVVETAFIPQYHTQIFRGFQELYGFFPIQIHCAGDAAVLYERFQGRNTRGERHPGHVDATIERGDFIRALESGRYDVLDLAGALIRLDMTDLAAVSYSDIIAQVRAYIAPTFHIL